MASKKRTEHITESLEKTLVTQGASSQDIATGSERNHAATLEIPPPMRELLLPSPTLDVASFVARSWPKAVVSLVSHKPERCFLRTVPSESGSCLLERSLPTKEFVDQALAYLDQALQDGASSIIDPNHRGGRLPLWSLSFWREGHEVAAAWKAWSKSTSWLSKHDTFPNTQPEIAQSRRSLAGLCWNEITKVKGAATSMCTVDFARVLSDTMLTTTLVDVLVNIIADHVQSDKTLSETFEVADLLFMHYIEQAKGPEHYQTKSRKYLHRLEEKLQGGRKILIYPMHIPERVHFISAEVDFEKRSISYGDSLPEKEQYFPPALKKVQWWLSARFDGPFSPGGRSLEHGVQSDGHSCGICSPNMIAHRVGYDPLWDKSRAPCERAKWFNRLVTEHAISLGEEVTNKKLTDPLMAAIAAPRTMAHLLNEPAIPVNSPLPSITYHSPRSSPNTEPPISSCVHEDLQRGTISDDDVDIPPVSEYASSSGYGESDMESLDDIERSDAPTMLAPKANGVSCGLGPPVAAPARLDDLMTGEERVIKPSSSRVGIEALLKREIEELEQDSDEDRNGKQQADSKRPRVDHQAISAAAKPSKSALASRALNQSVEDGTFEKSATKWHTFTTKIKELDKDAEFNINKDPRKVRHSKCQRAQKMDEPYHINAFRRHVNTCSGPSKAVKQKMAPTGVQSISNLFNKASASLAATTTTTIVEVPCPGLNPQNVPPLQGPKLKNYILRTPVAGAGGPTLDALTQLLYPRREFRSLTNREKQEVRAAQRMRHRWRIFDDQNKVFASTCKGKVRMTSGQDPASAAPCSECDALLRDKGFKNALALPTVHPDNLKFTPKSLISRTTIEKYGRISGLEAILNVNDQNPRSPCIVYAKNVLDGKYKDSADDVFVQLFEAVAIRKDKEERGVGLQNFKYGPAVKELSHLIQLQSPRVYQTVRNVLPLPTARSLQIDRARQPKFPIGIQDRCFDLVVEQLKQLDYNGPVGLACDDTKLTPAFRPYYDKTTDKYYLLGSTGKPMLLADPDDLLKVIKEGNLQKATKIRVWCLQVPVIGIPTIIVAGLAISESLGAMELLEFLEAILIDGLLARSVCVCSYAADGAGPERKLQRLLTAMAAEIRTVRIPHPAKGRSDITLDIPLFGPARQPIVMIQDSKHAAKTYRNNAFSGAKLLVLGNYPVHYHQFRLIAFRDGPLYRRDVEKMDRQDDGAATRLGSADTLDWLVKSDSPDLIGPVVYLFVFYELIDAYQSRSMKHIDRAHLAFCALFFVEMWEEFLVKAGYPKAKHLLSPEACDITRILIRGILQLIVVYRDLDSVYPLLLWLLTTEVCEHIFGLCRQIVKDFTELDFHYMIPKLFIRLREHVFFGKFSKGKERASGYNHTYIDNRDVDLNILSTYPSDDDLAEAAVTAYSEAESLWMLLGAPPSANVQRGSAHLPSLSSWFAEPEINSAGDIDEVHDRQSEDSCIGDWNEPLNHVSEAEEIQNQLDKMETFVLKSFKEEDMFNELALASIALGIADDIAIQELPEPTDGEMVAAYAEDKLTVSNSLRAVHLPPINMDPGSSRIGLSFDPSDGAKSHSISFEKLIALRRAHQTKQAATGTRKSVSQANMLTEARTKSALSAKQSESQGSDKQRLIKKFADIIKEYEVHGVSTGADRKKRWQGVPATGNAANAAKAAEGRSKKAMKKRANAYKKYSLDSDLSTAGLSRERELTHAMGDDNSNGWGFVLFGGKVMLARVLSIYKRSGDKNASHGWTPTASAITAVSYLSVQLFEHFNGRVFRAVPSALFSLQVKQFALLPSVQFVVVTDHEPLQMGHTENMQVSGEDASRYSKLADVEQSINLVIKNINSRPKKGKDVAESEDSESDE